MIEVLEYQDIILEATRLPDKVVLRRSVTYTVPQATTIGDYTDFSFAHGLPFIPLTFGTYSDDGFATSYEYGVGPWGVLTAFAQQGYVMRAHIWADATNVYIRAQSHNQARDITFHIVGLYNAFGDGTAYTIDSPETQDSLLLTTDSNFLKHGAVVSLTRTTDGSGSFETYTFATDIPYAPNVLMWVEENGERWLTNTKDSIQNTGFNCNVQAGPNRLYIQYKATTVRTFKFLIKVYYDA